MPVADDNFLVSAIIGVAGAQFFSRIGAGSAIPDLPLSAEMAVTLELLLHETSIEKAAASYLRAIQAAPATALLAEIDSFERQVRSGDALLVLHRQRLILVERQSFKLLKDLTRHSVTDRNVLCTLAHRCGLDARPLGEDEVRELAQELGRSGLIGPAIGRVNWGDLRRLVPICTRFGMGRGRPIDTYYLKRFVNETKDEVRGDVLEIGGVASNRVAYGYSRAQRYATLDLEKRDGVDLVGNAEDPSLVSPESYDVVIAFNVLEHCKNPSQVVSNVRRWLRPGGKALASVPSVQRMHLAPGDYTRFMPPGLELLFATWSERRLYVYGNPLAAVGALMGISAEELGRDELDSVHPDYPVTTCIVATA